MIYEKQRKILNQLNILMKKCQTFKEYHMIQYLKNKDKFNFPISIIKNEKGQEIVKWREMEGVILQNADKIDKEFNYRTECHVMSYKSAMKKLKNVKNLVKL